MLTCQECAHNRGPRGPHSHPTWPWQGSRGRTKKMWSRLRQVLSGYFSTCLIPAATARVKGGLRGGEKGGPRGSELGLEVLRPNSVPG